MYEAGKCKVNKWHGWRRLFHNEEAMGEYCEYCNANVIWKIIDGEAQPVDRFFESHIRDFCQPFGLSRQVFIDCNGYERIRELEQHEEDDAKKTRKIQDYSEQFYEAVKDPDRKYFS